MQKEALWGTAARMLGGAARSAWGYARSNGVKAVRDQAGSAYNYMHNTPLKQQMGSLKNTFKDGFTFKGVGPQMDVSKKLIQRGIGESQLGNRGGQTYFNKGLMIGAKALAKPALAYGTAAYGAKQFYDTVTG